MSAKSVKKFYEREECILSAAMQLLLEVGEGGVTLDGLAKVLGLSKGTLYKHFSSKDELYLRLLIRNELRSLQGMQIEDGAGAAVVRLIMRYMFNSKEIMMCLQIEDRMAAEASGMSKLFAELYAIRHQRMVRIVYLSKRYLMEQRSAMPLFEYIMMVSSLGGGSSLMLNSSFALLHLDTERRNTVKMSVIRHALLLPRLYQVSEKEWAEARDILEQDSIKLLKSIVVRGNDPMLNIYHGLESLQ